MKKLGIIDLISLDEYSITSKYLQIVNAVIRQIEKGAIRMEDNMPSINELSNNLDVSRDTVERAYRYLKNIGVIKSIPRKGYYIDNTTLRHSLKICLLFNKLSAHKKTIYDSFVANLGEQASVDFYIYNNDFILFKKLLANKKTDYTHYVIIPHFIDCDTNAAEIINAIPREKLVLLDKIIGNGGGDYAAAYENFEKDIYTGLSNALDPLSKYDTLKILFPENSYYPPEILRGFKNFCQDHTFSYKIVGDVSAETINEKEAYISVMEDDLVTLIEKIMLTGLRIGEQVGIISYNETPLKKIILNGITTISTDFHQMGVIAAGLILSDSREQVEVPFKLTLRPSL